jgi:transcriptional regulator with XRE-family HTH domain
MMRQIIGNSIKHHRLAKGITASQFAQKLNIDRQYLWNIENGKVNITSDYLDKIIQHLEIPHSDFIVRESISKI